MSESPNQSGNRSYHIGDVGTGARVAQGDNISWVEGINALPEGAQITDQFKQILDSIEADSTLDDDNKELARNKVEAIADALANIENNPAALRVALKDGKTFFSSVASGLGKAIASLLSSDAAQKILGTVTESATKAAISNFGF